MRSRPGSASAKDPTAALQGAVAPRPGRGRGASCSRGRHDKRVAPDGLGRDADLDAAVGLARRVVDGLAVELDRRDRRPARQRVADAELVDRRVLASVVVVYRLPSCAASTSVEPRPSRMLEPSTLGCPAGTCGITSRKPWPSDGRTPSRWCTTAQAVP